MGIEQQKQESGWDKFRKVILSKPVKFFAGVATLLSVDKMANDSAVTNKIADEFFSSGAGTTQTLTNEQIKKNMDENSAMFSKEVRAGWPKGDQDGKPKAENINNPDSQ